MFKQQKEYAEHENMLALLDRFTGFACREWPGTEMPTRLLPRFETAASSIERQRVIFLPLDTGSSRSSMVMSNSPSESMRRVY